MPSDKQMDGDVAAWVGVNFPGTEPKLLVEHPWADTWKFVVKGEPVYLKQIHGDGAQKIQAAVDIAKAFENNVPAVLAAEPNMGVMVVADHGGQELKSRTKHMTKVLPAYADLQAQAIHEPFDAQTFPRLQAINLLDDLLDFLASARLGATTGNVSAEHFLGSERAKRYHDLFSGLRRIILPHLAKTVLLPETINHCDLRPPNMALTDDGTVVLFDWDDAIWGPTGLSLHAQFSGCHRPHAALMADMTKEQSGEIVRDRTHLDTYIDAFTRSSEIDPEVMRKNLSSSIVAGTICYILGFQLHPVDSSKMRDVIKQNIVKRLRSIMSVVEFIVQDDPVQMKVVAKLYYKTGQERRLRKLQKRAETDLLDTL